MSHPQNTRQQVADELLQAMENAFDDFLRGDDQLREMAGLRFSNALLTFNELAPEDKFRPDLEP